MDNQMIFSTSLHVPGYSSKWFLMVLKPLSWVNDLMQDAPLIGLSSVCHFKHPELLTWSKHFVTN